MAIRNTKCHICAAVTKTVKNDTPPMICYHCGADLARPGSETVRKASRASYINKTGFGSQSGTLTLTNKRLFWMRNPNSAGSAVLGGVIGSAAASTMREGNAVECEISVGDITSAREEKQLLRSTLHVTVKNNSTVDFNVPKNENWIIALRK